MLECLSVTEITQLIALMHDDDMALFDVDLPTREVVFFKGLIEAYPGVAAVHAVPAVRGAPRTAVARLIVATSRSLEGELGGILNDLTTQIEGLAWKVSEHASVARSADGG